MPTVPSYCRQKCRGKADKAFTRIDGVRHYLGVYGSPESKAKYAALLAGQTDEEGQEPEPSAAPPDDPTVSEVCVAYLEHANIYYRTPDGRPGREYELTRDVVAYVRQECGATLAAQFGPRIFKRVRQRLIEADLSRKYINNQMDRVKRMFKWAAGEELLPASVPLALSMVAGLRKGRSTARETEPVAPVCSEVVDATIAELPEVVADMVQVQRLTGMRSGELVQMRPKDIDRSGEGVWIYTPPTHKTQHLQKSRIVAIGPKCQKILLKYLARADDMLLFRPCDSEAKRLAEREANRATPANHGNRRGSNRVKQPQRKAGKGYTRDSYRRAIARAAKAAEVTHWHPHQLRHTAATEIRRDFGLEAAQVVLGHANAAITEVYAERDLQRAAEVARKIG